MNEKMENYFPLIEDPLDCYFDYAKTEKISDISDEEFEGMLSEEEKLRSELREKIPINIGSETVTIERIVEIVQENKAEDLLGRWYKMHMKNRAVQIKRGDKNIKITPNTKKLLDVAKILKNNSQITTNL